MQRYYGRVVPAGTPYARQRQGFANTKPTSSRIDDQHTYHWPGLFKESSLRLVRWNVGDTTDHMVVNFSDNDFTIYAQIGHCRNSAQQGGPITVVFLELIKCLRGDTIQCFGIRVSKVPECYISIHRETFGVNLRRETVRALWISQPRGSRLKMP